MRKLNPSIKDGIGFILLKKTIALIKMEKILQITVKPNAPETKILEQKGQELRIALNARPVEGEANKELLRFLKKQFGCEVEIIKGLKSRKKIVKII